MNAEQYIPALVSPFDCDYYEKEFKQNQHMGKHCFIQRDGKGLSEYRHSQAVNTNSEPFVPFEADSYPCGGKGLNFPQIQHRKERRLVLSDVLPLGEQRNSQPSMSNEANNSNSNINGMDFTQQQQHAHDQNVIQNEILPAGSGNCDSRPARKGKQTRERTFICEVCGRGFYEMASLTVHSRIHSGERPFPCEACDKTFASREGLRSHLVVHSEEKRFPCDLCDKKFARKQQMQHHRVIHTGEKPHVCEICQRAFPIKRRLSIHMRVHTEERPYACDQCDKKFKSRNQVKKHKRYHAEEKTFLCELCPMRFRATHNLRLHQRVHTGLKPYHCKLCPMQYSNKNSFLKHVQSHVEQTDSQTLDINPDSPPVERDPHNNRLCTQKKVPYLCVTCRVEFPEQCELEKHQIHHKREKPFACFICQVRFFRSPNLKLHLITVHRDGVPQVDSQGKRFHKSELFPCAMCDKSLFSKAHLRSHILRHLREDSYSERNKQGKFAGDQCGKRFAFKKNLRSHVLVNSSMKKLHQCVVCSKKFISRSILRQHTQIHIEEKACACPVCHKKFARRKYLLKHFRCCHKELSNLQKVKRSSEHYTSDEENISLAVLKNKILKAKHSMNKV